MVQPQSESSTTRPPMLAAPGEPVVSELTCLLQQWRDGRSDALEEIVELAYGELRRLAQHQVNAEPGSLALQATELVHETYLRLANKEQPQWRDRGHFFAVTSLIMRRILIDQARWRAAPRHGGDLLRLELDSVPSAELARRDDPMELAQAIGRLARFDMRRAQIVALRCFGGFSLDETAALLGVSQATVVRDWRLARAWLLRDLGPSS
ncbi:MAG: ECF-type sigma factor [Acidobacteriota bacterium]